MTEAGDGWKRSLLRERYVFVFIRLDIGLYLETKKEYFYSNVNRLKNNSFHLTKMKGQFFLLRHFLFKLFHQCCRSFDPLRTLFHRLPDHVE